MPAPLEGYRILDFTRYYQGPHGTVMLADMGAEVIKVEPRVTGEPNRVVAQRPDGFSPTFQTNNRGKKSITVDTRKELGAEIIKKLVTEIDAVVENFRPGVMDRMGLGYDVLSRINPRLIYASASAFGLRGPMTYWPGYDICAEAMSGLMVANQESDGTPRLVGLPTTPFADHLGGMQLAMGVMIALLARERWGIGQSLDVSLLGTMVETQAWPYCWRPGVDQITSIRGGTRARGGVTYNHYRAADGKWVAVAAIGGANLWLPFCQALGIEWVSQDPRFANPRDRAQHGQELFEIVEKSFLSKPRDEWVRIFNEHDIPVAPIYDYAEAAVHPQIRDNDYLVTIDHPKWGQVQQVGLAVQLTKTPGKIGILTPEVGEHTEEILAEVGYTAQQIAELREQEVI